MQRCSENATLSSTHDVTCRMFRVEAHQVNNGCRSGKRQGHYAAEEQSGKCYLRQQGSDMSVENGRNKQMVAQWTVNGVDQNNISNELVIPSLTGKTDVGVCSLTKASLFRPAASAEGLR